MTDKRPTQNPADHAEEFARRWADRFDEYRAIRRDDLGIPDSENVEAHPATGAWRAFVPKERTGGSTSWGITVNSGALNPDPLRGKKGARVWPKARLRDRSTRSSPTRTRKVAGGPIEEALKAAPKTELAITEGARRI